MNIFRRFLCILVVFMIGTFCMSACDANQLLTQPVEAPPLAPTVNSAVNVEVPEVAAPSIPEAEIAENMDSQELMASVAENLQMGAIVETSQLQVGEVNLTFAVTESLIRELEESNIYTAGEPVWVIRESRKQKVAEIVEELIIRAFEVKNNIPEGSIKDVSEILSSSIPVKVRLNDPEKIVYEVRNFPVASLINASVMLGSPQFGTNQIFFNKLDDGISYVFDEQSGQFSFILSPKNFETLPQNIAVDLAAANDSMSLTDNITITDESGTRLVTLEELLFTLRVDLKDRALSTFLVFSLITLGSNGTQEANYVLGSDDEFTFPNLVPKTLSNNYLNELGVLAAEVVFSMSVTERFQNIIDTTTSEIITGHQ